MRKEKGHLNFVVIARVESGKSTTTGHLIYQLGSIDESNIEKIRKGISLNRWGIYEYA